MGCGRTFGDLNGVYLSGGSHLASRLPGGFLIDPMIGEISATGGVLIMGLGVVKRLRVANYLPALLIAPLVVVILTMMG